MNNNNNHAQQHAETRHDGGGSTGPSPVLAPPTLRHGAPEATPMLPTPRRHSGSAACRAPAACMRLRHDTNTNTTGITEHYFFSADDDDGD
mmetsp:Transcript_31663/g.67450  ORF Transcript_31663/g.67450 Transcript_31663/m.67450 type:complete len:91 (+) Transcript_31663:199-471(+)